MDNKKRKPPLSLRVLGKLIKGTANVQKFLLTTYGKETEKQMRKVWSNAGMEFKEPPTKQKTSPPPSPPKQAPSTPNMKTDDTVLVNEAPMCIRCHSTMKLHSAGINLSPAGTPVEFTNAFCPKCGQTVCITAHVKLDPKGVSQKKELAFDVYNCAPPKERREANDRLAAIKAMQDAEKPAPEKETKETKTQKPLEEMD